MEKTDAVWLALRGQAERWAASEPALASLVSTTILNHTGFGDALSYYLAKKIDGRFLNAMQARDLITESFRGDPQILKAARADLAAIVERNPACRSHLEAFLFYKGYHALEAYRTAHWFWRKGRRSMALLLQSRISRRFTADIHPGARIGEGVMIDHASGVVIGENAIIEDGVSMLHGVTLGGAEAGDGHHHPHVQQNVLLSVGATVLGDVDIGERSRVGAGSVVLQSIPADSSAVGLPARVIERVDRRPPSQTMDHVGE